MKKKIITYLLLFSFLNYLGCSSTQYITVKEYETEMLEVDPPSEIIVTTNDSKKYHFTNDASYCYTKNDTLYARITLAVFYYENDKKVETGETTTFHRKFPLQNIKSIEESGPNKIRVITISGKELHFVNEGYYYFENDTLYGKGEIQVVDDKQNFEGKIALVNIKSVNSGLLINGEYAEDEINLVKQNEDEGAEVTVLLKDGTEIYGELLSVRDSSIIICTEYSASEEELANLTYTIVTIPNGKIQELTIQEGHSYVIIGMGAGIIGGYFIGLGVAWILLKDDKSDMVGIGYALIAGLGMLLGLGAGGAIGSANSTDDVVLKDI
ncbi:MAG: hypothetical protein KAQ90_03265, partial [Melioribacteraceae bacterium]|nr:hypothetical protein [Melioribacteraceae bacterium]